MNTPTTWSPARYSSSNLLVVTGSWNESSAALARWAGPNTTVASQDNPVSRTALTFAPATRPKAALESLRVTVASEGPTVCRPTSEDLDPPQDRVNKASPITRARLNTRFIMPEFSPGTPL